uniref:Uncharacterized protein n=1 Tax=Ciona savignyi TaxID=51511 RepID=H2YKD3_CIOSA
MSKDLVTCIQITVDQLLSRNLLPLIRQVLNSNALVNANVLKVYKYMESRGIYSYPKIAHRPHLVLIPYTMGLVEMTLVLYRHLVELSMFLVELGEKLRTDLPLRVVLIWNVGGLTSLVTNPNVVRLRERRSLDEDDSQLDDPSSCGRVETFC